MYVIQLKITPLEALNKIYSHPFGEGNLTFAVLLRRPELVQECVKPV